ncbi:polycystin family receptor for egg jelly-like isoform X2 [Ptychodera flava]|uniref:polycystin family receptor for egg jelly-like isoform X2 n=1 Tax=Ptychodera flava TaxID=63121 RepID=UPI003969F6AC
MDVLWKRLSFFIGLLILAKGSNGQYLGCYFIDKENRVFGVSPGNYDPNALTIEMCTGACSNLGYHYAAVEAGAFCFCSDNNYDLSAVQPDDTNCDTPCTGDNAVTCGSHSYSKAYETPSPISVFLDPNVNNFKVFTPSSASIFNTTGPDLLFSFNYGDDSGDTPLQSSQTFAHSYTLPGEYIVTVAADNNYMSPAYDAIRVYAMAGVDRMSLECPLVVQPGDEVRCITTVIEGSDMTLSMDLGSAQVPAFSIADPLLFAFGRPVPQYIDPGVTDGGGLLGGNSDVWIVPEAEITEYGRLIAWEVYISDLGTDSTIELLVLRPDCDYSAGTSYCAKTNLCESSCAGVWNPDANPLYQDICTSSEVFCLSRKRCVPRDTPNTCDAEPQRHVQSGDASLNPMSDYRVVWVYTATVTSTGYNLIKLESIPDELLFNVDVGDKLGFRAHVNGAQIGYHGVAIGDPIEFKYDNIASTPTIGELFPIGSSVSSAERHLIRAITSDPSLALVTHSYLSTGEYTVSSTATNSLPSDHTVSTIVHVQEPIAGLYIEVDVDLIGIGDDVVVKAWVSTGTPVNYTWSWGDGNEEVTTRQAASYADPDEKIHTYSSDGHMVITVNASNYINSLIETYEIDVQRPVLRNYQFTHNAPVHDDPVTYNIQYNPGVNEYPPTDAQFMVVFGDFENSSITTLGLTNPGDVNSDVTHVFRFADEYAGKIIIFNLVSREEFDVVAGSYETITNLGILPLYIPPTSNDGTAVVGHGPLQNIFPMDSEVVFEGTHDTGTTITYTYTDFGDGPPVPQVTTEKRFSHKYNAIGPYTVHMDATNAVTPTVSTSKNIEIQANIKGISILEGGQTAANEAKDFTVDITHPGTDSCIAIDYGDGSPFQFYGVQVTCSQHANYQVSGYVTTLSASNAISHTYTSTGSFRLRVHGFNLVSFYEVSQDFTVSDVDCRSPSLSIRDGSPYWQGPRAVYRFNPILIQGITYLQCAATRNNFKAWSYVEINPSTGLEIPATAVDLASLTESDPRYLPDAETAEIRLPPYYLTSGTYKFTYYVQMDPADTNGDVFSGYVNEFIEVKTSDLEVRVLESEATRIEVGWGQVFTLEPRKYSRDPDIAPNLDQGFTKVLYYCRQVYEPWPLTDNRELDEGNPVGGYPKNLTRPAIDQGGCFNAGPGLLDHSDWTLPVDTTYMTENVTHEFMTIVESGTKRGNNTVFVTVTTGDPPIMEIDCAPSTECFQVFGGRKINPSSSLRMTGSCLSGCHDDLTYQWQLQFYNYTSEEYENIDGWRSFATGDRTPYLHIKRDLFERNPTWTRYSMTLTGTRPSGISGSSYLTIYLNQPPSGGTCSVTPTSGVVSTDLFSVQCNDWIDEDGIKNYQFYSVSANSTVPKQITFGMQSNMEMFPPLGSESNAYFQELMVKIYDDLGAYTTVLIDEIQVRPPDDKDAGDIMEHLFNKTVGDLRQYADLAASGNTREINKQVLIDASQLNGLSIADRNEYENQYGDYSTTTASVTPEAAASFAAKELGRNRRAYLRGVFMNSVSSGSLDSMEDLTLVSSTTSVVTEVTTELSHDALVKSAGLVTDLAGVFSELSSTTDEETLDVAAKGILGTIGNVLEGVHHAMMNPLTVLDQYEETGQEGTDVFESVYQSSVGTYTDWVDSPSEEIITPSDQVIGSKESKSRQTVNFVESALTSVTRSLLKTKLPGEDPLEMETSSISVKLQRSYPFDIANRTFVMGKGSFAVPEWCAIKNSPGQNCDMKEIVDMELLKLSKNPYLFNGENSLRVSEETEVMVLNYRNVSGDEMSIVNTAKPIEAYIPRPANTPAESTYYSSQPLNDTVMVFHNFNVSDVDTDCSVYIEVVPDDFTVQFAMYLRYMDRPTADEYDERVLIPSNMALAGQTNLKPSPYALFLDNSYIGDNVGKYVVALVELDNTHADYNAFVSGANVEIPAKAQFSTNYTLTISVSACLYWSASDEQWATDGCQVGSDTNYLQTQCLCSHLTNFASAWIIPPNEIDFDYVFANMDFYKNPTIYIVTIVVFVLYFIGLIWARRKDKKDLLMLGITPLLDNDPNDKYLYEIIVLTGRRKNAGTNSKVNFILSGDDDETEVRAFEDDKRKLFRRGTADGFLMAVPRPLGTLNYMRIWHDNSGKGKMQSWYLTYIAIRDLQTGQRFYFIANRWFSVVEDDGQIDRLLPVAGKEQMQGFDHVFSSTTRKNLDDGHLWFSVFARPPRSRFTRCQRLSCCMMALWLEMLVNIMWYGVAPPQTGDSLEFGPFSLSPAQISIGIQSNLIVFPISILVIQIFRKSRPKKKRRSRIEIAKEQLAQKRNEIDSRSSMVSPSHIEVKPNNDEMYLLDFEEKEDGDKFMSIDAMVASENEKKLAKKEKRKKKKKKAFGFPHWCIYIAWFLVFLSVAVAVTFVTFYAIQLGDLETRQWFTSLIISFLTAIFLTQPIKVLLLSVFVALVLKTPNADEDEDAEEDEDDYELADDEEWLHKPVKPAKERKLAYKPMDETELNKAREQRMKEIKMYAVIREILFYIFFLWLLLVISYGNRDPNAFSYMEHLKTLLAKEESVHDFYNVTTRERFWSYTHNYLVPSLSVGNWYNGDPPGDDMKGFLVDRCSRIMGYAVLRQLRIPPGLCEVHKKFDGVVNECNVEYSVMDDVEDNFGVSWTAFDPNNTVDEYMYTTAEELDGYPFLGRHSLYSGGGYVAKLLGNTTELHNLFYRLESENWIDDYTKAVFVEFSTYNAQVNIFAVVVLLLEILPTGAAYPLVRIDPIKLLSYFSGFALFQVVCEGLFLAFVVFFLFKELNHMRQQKKHYFKSFWNWIELWIVALSISAIVIYFYRFLVSNKLSTRFKETGGNGYIKLQYVAYWNELLGYLLGLIVFLANLKFLKLLRFNKRMSFLSSTLRAAAKDIFYFFIMFAIIFAAFAQSFYLVFSRKVFDFADFIYTLEALFGTMLGKFKWNSMKEADSVMAPLLFFFFVMSITFILINMFLTILNENFSEVKRNTEKQSNEYEMVDFMMGRFKLWTGLGQTKNRAPSPLVPNNKVKPTLEESIEDFPNKVDQLLDSITKMYFEPTYASKDPKNFRGNDYKQDLFTKDSNILRDPANLKKQFKF